MNQEEKYTSKQSAYSCMYLTMKDLNVSTYEYMIMQLKNAIMEIYKRIPSRWRSSRKRKNF